MCLQCACWLCSAKTATLRQFIGAGDNKNRINPFNLPFFFFFFLDTYILLSLPTGLFKTSRLFLWGWYTEAFLIAWSFFFFPTTRHFHVSFSFNHHQSMFFSHSELVVDLIRLSISSGSYRLTAVNNRFSNQLFVATPEVNTEVEHQLPHEFKYNHYSQRIGKSGNV